MDGVGEVQVMVTLVTSKELIVEKDEPVTRNTITESDGAGGTRSTNESSYDYETIYETDGEGNKNKNRRKILRQIYKIFIDFLVQL